MAVVFRQVDGTNLFDLTVDGRAAEYDVEQRDFGAALRRLRNRVPKGAVVYVEDETGHRTRLSGR